MFIASVTESECADDFRLVTFGAFAKLHPFFAAAILTDGFASVTARIHRSHLSTHGTFLMRGGIFAVAVLADGFAGLGTGCHSFNLATPGTFLVRGRIFAVAVRTDGFAGLAIFTDDSGFSADSTSTLHAAPPFDFRKSKFRAGGRWGARTSDLRNVNATL